MSQDPSTSARLSVAVLMGGMSPEHDVSLATGRMVVGALDRARYDIWPVVLERDGFWLFPEEPNGPIPDGERAGQRWSVGTALDLLAEKTDVAFLAVHGPFGEDGTLQGLLEMAQVRYTGSGVLASSLAMDKERSRWVFSHLGLTIPPGLCLERSTWRDRRTELIRQLETGVPHPWVVKPVDQGSSVGIFMVDDASGLDAALEEVYRYSNRALVEERIVGEEATCGVLEKPGGDALLALPVTLIRPREDAFFDYHAKYTPGATDEITPAPLSEDLTRSIQDQSMRAFLGLGCRGMCRFDYMLRDETAFLLEGNTIPGMTETSLLPQAAEVAGLPFPKLLDRLIQLALENRAPGENRENG